MINPLDELSDIYLGQISEADNSPEAIKARVMQHVRAIRYRARKEGDQLNKAYNDYMAGQAGISATEKSMVKERLGLTGGSQHQEGMAYGLSRGSGKPSGPMAAFGKKAPRMQKGAMAYDGPNKAASEAKDRVMAKTKAKRKGPKPTVTIDKPDSLVSMKVSKGYKESFDKLVESGKFSDIELQRIIFDDFEENYRAMRNPEKYAEKPESEMSYDERRKKRMNDPKTAINSPAFKKFMADRGM